MPPKLLNWRRVEKEEVVPGKYRERYCVDIYYDTTLIRKDHLLEIWRDKETGWFTKRPPVIKYTKKILHVRFRYEARGKQGYHPLYVEGIVTRTAESRKELERGETQAEMRRNLRQFLYDQSEWEAPDVSYAIKAILESPETTEWVVGENFEDTDEPPGREEYEWVDWGH